MNLYARLSALSLDIADYDLDAQISRVSSDFDRHTTTVRLRGAGEEGLGEDVTYHAGDQLAFQRRGADLPLAGVWTFDAFSRHLHDLPLFVQSPADASFRNYRRWAFESAALDLALRQAGMPLHAVLGVEPQPVRFVVSLRLGDPPSANPVLRLLDRIPELKFKLDATSAWQPDLMHRLAATGAVESIDLKGAYRGTIVDQPADLLLYRRVVESFPEAWIEDPALTAETAPILEPHRERITWDAPIHDVADIEGLPFPPRSLNIKPSRSGRLETLLALYEHCRARGIDLYGGGQFELGAGRGQIQYLASLFHPYGPNDVAPGVFNRPDPPPALPRPPLAPRPAPIGFRWLDEVEP